ncbi:MAG: hypothetical protein ABI723_18510 [Bacteroidia bacterium]
MKKLLLILPTIILFLNSCAQSKKQETFEGTITYKIAVMTKTDNANYNDYQAQKYGDKAKVYISKDGSFKREYLTSGQKGFVFFTYNALTNKCFTKWRNIDTIYSSNCSENSLTLVEEKDLPGETILGQACNGYFISGVDPRGGQPVSLTYFYPKNKEYINPTLYKNYKDFFYNKVIEKAKAPFYKLVMDMGKYIVTFEIVNIETGLITQEFIKIPTNIPVKEM